ncbi:MAG TPA: LamG-like jellyroll fold domain-containing protein [Micavibrio sp.]|nr:LamG-like jellyroll fold domain-containing protein [Micavibrio sp.]
MLFTSLVCIAGPVYAEPLKGRAETNWRYGHERSILMTEFWAPITQGDDDVLYTDLRLMGDDQDNREGNLGLGYRHVLDLPILGEGIGGVNGWFDRRISERGSHFHQGTFGAEWLGDVIDLRFNTYFGLSDPKKSGSRAGTETVSSPFFSGNGIFIDLTPGGQMVVEEVMDGFDGEVGFTIPVLQDHIESIRFYTGGYYFSGDHSEEISGWRTRLTLDITSDVQVGARFQKDDERGSQGFLEATIRFPFGNKKSVREDGLRGRLDESPERDIDIVTGTATTGSSGGPARRIAVVNGETNSDQRILHVDNGAAGGGNGSWEAPFNSLQDAEAAAIDNDMIYVHRGNGTTLNQDTGIALARSGLTLHGSGAPLYVDSTNYRVTGTAVPNSLLVAAGGSAPVITNSTPDGDGITITADKVSVRGVTVDSADRYGIAVVADGGGASATDVKISNITATGNRTGIYVHGANGGAVGASIEQAITTGNTLHGISVYDDTNGTFDVDLGGGTLQSAGSNVITGNGLEDLTIDYDGRQLSAAGNWWGQAGGPQADQVYFGSPLDNMLVGHWLLDETSGTTIASRIGAHTGTFVFSPTLDPAGLNNGAVSFDRADSDYITIPDFDEADTGNKLTVSYWVNPDTVQAKDGHIMKWEEDTVTKASSWAVRATPAGDELYFFVAEAPVDAGNNYFETSNLDLSAGTWTNITFVYDGAGAGNADRLKVYKDGVQVAGSFGGTIPATLHDTNESIAIGRTITNNPAFSDYLDGKFDDVRIYNSALTAAEVGQITRSRADSTIDSAGSLSSAP